MEGLLIREPWISRILAGRKTWEMRRGNCRKRGRFALIRAGSGMVVGLADMVDCLSPLESAEEYAAAEQFHAIRPDEQQGSFDGGWRTPWVLANILPLQRPISYRHPSGAQQWVRLGDDVAAAIDRANLESLGEPNLALVREAGCEAFPPGTAWPHANGNDSAQITTTRAKACGVTSAAASRSIVLSGGAIRNHYLKLPLDFFPADAIGGFNKHEPAAQSLRVIFDPGTTVKTDIDSRHRMLRERGAVRDFFVRAELQEGDSVLIERTAPYIYRFSKA